MPIRWKILIGMAFLTGIAGAQEVMELKSQKEKQSYSLGVNFGKGFQKQSLALDLALFNRGIEDGLSGSETLLTEAEMRAALAALQAELKDKHSATRAEKLEHNRTQEEAFLAENKSKEGVVTLESGLQYKILEPGYGNIPTASDTVICNYRGTLIDGAEFASTYKSGQPITFPVQKVIPGWKEALQIMPVGSRWQLFVPSKLAYGVRGQGRTVAPNSMLVFEIELISIKDTAAAQAAWQADPLEEGIAMKQGKPETSAVTDAALSDIQVSFKMDPRLMGGTYGGERWISPQTFMAATAQDVVDARVLGIDAGGRPVNISPRWTSSDPGMVTVSPDEGHTVKITVKHPGESTIEVASGGISRKLSVKAKQQGKNIQVEISKQ